MLHLNATNLQDASHYRNHWAAVVDAAATIDDVQRPEFWLHVGARLRRMDIIAILPEDETWFAELLVTSAGNGFAKVMVLRHVELEASDPVRSAASSSVKWRGPQSKWSVVRDSDDMVMSEKHESRESATKWQMGHERALAA